ncbi:hypothetical protein ACFQU2_14575 [Siccirubricoccus deserti]
MEALKPESFEGHTTGDTTNNRSAKWPWRLDDERLMDPFYERSPKAGHDIARIHKGMLPIQARFPRLLPYANVDDMGNAAKIGRRSASSATIPSVASPAARWSEGWSSSSAPAGWSKCV